MPRVTIDDLKRIRDANVRTTALLFKSSMVKIGRAHV